MAWGKNEGNPVLDLDESWGAYEPGLESVIGTFTACSGLFGHYHLDKIINK